MIKQLLIKISLLIIGILFFNNSYSQATLVQDINIGGDATPRFFITIGNTLYFTANDGVNGEELWKHDGTTTTLIDINPGATGSAPRVLTEYNSELYFTASTGTIGRELWKYDGATASLVADLYTGTNNSANPNYLTVLGTDLFFTAKNSTSGASLWKYNGTNPPAIISSGYPNNNPRYLTVFNNEIFYNAFHIGTGNELWKHDGTTATIIQDVYPGQSGANPGTQLLPVGDNLFFASNGSPNTPSNAYGVEPHRYNTAVGIQLLKDVWSAGSSNPLEFTAVGTDVYFRANNGTEIELWKYNGSTTTMIDVQPGTIGSNPTGLIALGSSLYFRANDGVHGSDLMKYDGTTLIAIDINPGVLSSAAHNLTVVGTDIYMSARNETDGFELWKHNTITGVTTYIQDINIGSGNSVLFNDFVLLNDVLYFSADDGINGNELWKLTPTNPEIDIIGNNTSITNNDTTPSTDDFTDFDSSCASITRTFTIDNSLGTDVLTLLNNSPNYVTISGDGNFTISTQPANGTIAAGGSTTFNVTYTPTGIGTHNATVSVLTDDLDESTYSFNITGNATVVTPQTVTVSPNSGICSTNATVSLTASETGVTYYLRDNNDNAFIGTKIVGTGTAIDFSSETITSTKTYNVIGGIEETTTGLNFDGTDNVVIIPNANALNPVNITLETWATSSTDNWNTYSAFINKRDGTAPYLFGGNENSRVIRFDYTTTTGTNLITYDIPVGIDIKEWHHYAVTYNGTTAAIYIDGVLVKSLTASSPGDLISNTGAVRIGQDNCCGSRYHLGELFGVRIWSTVRSETEIANTMCSIDQYTTGLEAYYRSEEGSGLVLNDVTGNGNNGTLTNMDSVNDWITGPTCLSCPTEMTNTPTVTVTSPEMDVKDEYGTSITLGDTIDFGSTFYLSHYETTFTIENTGNADLILSGTPIISVIGDSDFTVTVNPTSTVTSGGGTTTFTVRYTPMTSFEVVNTATISIASNDCDENPYTFNVQGDTILPLYLEVDVFLQGAALNPNSGEETLMRDDLRVAGLIPTTSPYADNLTCNASVFNVTGNDAIVDWVWVELRQAGDNTAVSHSQSALLQRDGDVVTTNGTFGLTFNEFPANYHVAIKHRNHLGIMTTNAIAITTGITTVDFTNATTPITFGTNAQTSFGMPTDVVAMWSGDISENGQIRFLGPGNDLNVLKNTILTNPENLSGSLSFPISGYNHSDLNLNGQARFLGPGNETNLLKSFILSSPTNTSNSLSFPISQQIPN